MLLLELAAPTPALAPLRMVRSAVAIVIQHFVKGSNAAVVHVRRSHVNVPQRWHTELTGVGFTTCVFKEPRVRCGIRRVPRNVVETGIVIFQFGRLLPYEVFRIGKIQAGMTVKALKFLANEKLFAAGFLAARANHVK
jgi:hypothetical protein